MYKELPFCSKIDVLNGPFTEVCSVQLNEAHVLQGLVETLAAHTEAVFLDETVLVGADEARTRNPDRIFSHGSRRAAGDPSCSLMQRGKRALFLSFQTHKHKRFDSNLSQKNEATYLLLGVTTFLPQEPQIGDQPSIRQR